MTGEGRRLKVALAFGSMAFLAYALQADTIKLSTVYPAPSGVYRKLIATKEAHLARDGGLVSVGSPLTPANMDVAGNLRVLNGTMQAGTLGADPPNGANGMIYYNSTMGRLRAFENGAWKDLGGTGAIEIAHAYRAVGPGHVGSRGINVFAGPPDAFVPISNASPDAGSHWANVGTTNYVYDGVGCNEAKGWKIMGCWAIAGGGPGLFPLRNGCLSEANPEDTIGEMSITCYRPK